MNTPQFIQSVSKPTYEEMGSLNPVLASYDSRRSFNRCTPKLTSIHKAIVGYGYYRYYNLPIPCLRVPVEPQRVKIETVTDNSNYLFAIANKIISDMACGLPPSAAYITALIISPTYWKVYKGYRFVELKVTLDNMYVLAIEESNGHFLSRYAHEYYNLPELFDGPVSITTGEWKAVTFNDIPW